MDGMFALCDVTRPLLDVVEIMRQRRDEFVIRKKERFCVLEKQQKSQFYQHKISIGGTAIHIVIRFAKI